MCAIFIAFPLQKWLQEWVSISHYTHIACFVLSCLLHISLDLALASIWLLICSVNIIDDEFLILHGYYSVCLYLWIQFWLLPSFLKHCDKLEKPAGCFVDTGLHFTYNKFSQFQYGPCHCYENSKLKLISCTFSFA